MFTRLSPQKVQSDAGFVVQSKDRETMQYIEGDFIAEAYVEAQMPPGGATTLKGAAKPIDWIWVVEETSVRGVAPAPQALATERRQMIAHRIAEGLRAMGEEAMVG